MTKSKLNIESGLLAMPEALRLFTVTNCVSASPYNRYASGSFYSKEGKSWDYTPEDCIRVSDHWNFYSRGKIHCKTNVPNDKLAGKWVVAKYNTTLDIYEVISVDEKDYAALKVRESRSVLALNLNDNLKTIKRNVAARQARKIRRIELRRNRAIAAERAAALEAGYIYYSGYVIDYSSRAGGRGRRYFSSTNSDVCGRVYSESAQRTNGRKVNSYRELDIRNFEDIKPQLKCLFAIGNIDPLRPSLNTSLITAYDLIVQCGATSNFI